MNLNTRITNHLKFRGASLVGFANLTSLHEKSRWNFKNGILIAIAFSGKAMENHKNGDPSRYHKEYMAINQKLNKIAKDTVKFLEKSGYESFAMLESLVPLDARLATPLPYKTVAILAGLGWIGKCSLLVTPQFGSAIRMTAVLTNAPVECGRPLSGSRCSENCKVCTGICPVNAVHGRKWRPGMEREELLNPNSCFPFAVGFAKDRLGVDDIICGLCLCNCPWTKKAFGYL